MISFLKLKYYLIFSLPILTAFFFILLKSLSFDVFGFSQSYLTNLWGIIFYFSVFNARALNIIAVFLLGMIADILLQIPFGVSPIMYSFVYFIGQFNRRLIKMNSFKLQWMIYIFAITCLFLTGLILLKILYTHIPHINYLVVEYCSLILFYPLIATLCGKLNALIGRYQ